MKDFSQSGEQASILEWADRHGAGRWLDLGAADGHTMSNTRALALQGWPGVAVEPAAVQFDALVDLYHDSPDIDCVQALVADDQAVSLVPFHYARDLVSTTRAENVGAWAAATPFYKCWAAQVSLVELLHHFPGPYDFVSVDTEGTSVELWDELRNVGAFAVGALVCVEAADGGERWEIQRACLEGWARVLVTENNVLLEKISR